MKRYLAAAALALLAAPAAASAHPGVYTVVQQQLQPSDTCRLPDDSCIADNTRIQYSVANDGWAQSFTEGNLAPAGRGLLNYKALPGTWRGTGRAAILDYARANQAKGAVTDLQAHATCLGASWDTPANILAWQEDPFFNYIPWQATSVSLGDDPADWLPLVKSLTGVDLTTLKTADAIVAACTNAGGAYYPPDVLAPITSALETAIRTPLQDQVTTLQTQLAAAETARRALLARPLALTLSGNRTPNIAMVTGSAGTSVKISLLLSSADAKKLSLSRTLATRTQTLDGQGAALFSLTPSKTARKAIKKQVKVTVEAVGGGLTKTASGVYVG